MSSNGVIHVIYTSKIYHWLQGTQHSGKATWQVRWFLSISVSGSFEKVNSSNFLYTKPFSYQFGGRSPHCLSWYAIGCYCETWSMKKILNIIKSSNKAPYAVFSLHHRIGINDQHCSGSRRSVILYHYLWMLGSKETGGVHAGDRSPLEMSGLLWSMLSFSFWTCIMRILGEKSMYSFFALMQLLCSIRISIIWSLHYVILIQDAA